MKNTPQSGMRVLRTLKQFTQGGWLLAVVGACLLSPGALQAQTMDYWIGTGNWSTTGNWGSGVVPDSSYVVGFGNDMLYPGVATGLVDNIVDQNFTINGMQYQTASTNGGGYHTTQINPGLSLNINGVGGEALFVGSGLPTGGTINYYQRIVGPGKLTVTNTSGVIDIVQGGDNNDHYATLDLAGLTNFSASVGQIFVGCISNTGVSGLRPMGILRLAETNFIATAAGTTAPGILVAGYPTSDTNLRGTEQMLFGWHNVINSDAISIGGTKTTGALTVRPGVTNGYVSLRGSAGPTDKVKILGVGDGRAGMFNYNPGGTGSGNTGTFNSSGTYLDALVQDIFVPRSQIAGTGSATGTLTIGDGNVQADNLYIGYHTTGITTTANATGTVNVNGAATVTVNNDLVMARKIGSSTPVATLNIATNATVGVKGNLVTSGGTSTLNFNGGTLNMQPAGDTTPGSVTVSTLTGSGTILNAANITNTAALTPGTTTTAGALTVGNSLTLSNGAVINVNFASTTDAASNDLVTVTGNLVLNSNVVNIVPLGNSLAVGSSYPLFNFSGTLSGYLNFTNPTRYLVTPTYSASQIALTVSGGGPGSLKWAGTTNGVWDLATSNWVNTANSAKDKFLTFDSVTIDESGTYTNNVLLTTTLFPNAVTVYSITRDYTLGGNGKLSGATALTKQGNATLIVSNVNDFTGPVYINGGTVRLGSGSAFGTSAGGVFVGPNATLDLMGTNMGSDLLTIQGTGLNNTGAVINTGLRQDNAIRLLSLADNATIGTYGLGRYDVRGAGGNSSFSGLLDLAGHYLFKMGSTQFSVVDSVCTNPGTFQVLGGCLALTRSKVEGDGTINLFSNMLFFENCSTGYVTKPINVGGGIIRVTGNNFALWAPITNTTGLNIDNSVVLEITNLISGAGGMTKSSGGNLILDTTPSYTGPTVVSGGRLTLSNATLSATKSIAVLSGATLDATAAPGAILALTSGQVLSGSGTVIGDVSVPDAAGIVPGTSAGTLTLSNNLTMNNSSNVFELSGDPSQIGNGANDLLVVNGNLTLNGVNHFKIAPLATLSTASPYTLVQYSGTLAGGLANISVDSDSRYTFTVVDPATTPGYIQVNVTGSGASGNLVWKGGFLGNPNAWDTKSTPNWLNTATLANDVFYVGDNVTFDDTASTSLVTLSGPTQPAATWMKNNTLNYTFNGTGSLAMGSYTNDGSGTVSFANTGMNTFSAATINAGTLTLANTGDNLFASGATLNLGTFNINNAGVNTFGGPLVVNAGSVVFNQAGDTLFAGVISDANGTGGTIEKRGANALTLSGNNSGFNGPILVSAGTLRAGNGNALGTANGGTTIASGATLDINGQALYNPGDVITLSGTGVGGLGAVVNTGGNQNNAVRALSLANNATIGAWAGRWDVRGPGGNGTFSGAINLNGFTLTKIGPATNSIVDCNVTDPGNIVIAGGLVGMTRCYVDGTGSINLLTNVLLLENWQNPTVGYFNKPLVSSGGTLRLVGNALAIGSPITNNVGGIFMDLTQTLTVNNIITGPGLLTKLNSSTLILAYTNDYRGGTFISAGTLQIGDGASGGYDGVLPPQPLGTALTNNGTLTFNRADDYIMNDQITGTGTVRQNAGGTVFLNASNSFTGPTILASTTTTAPGGAALRISNSWALGTTNGNTQIQGNTGGNNRLELVGNFTLAEPFQLDARQQGTADIPHIENVSGTNILTGALNGNTGGSEYNLQADSGSKLLVAGNFVPPSSGGTRRLKLMGDGVGEWSGVISNGTDNTTLPHVVKTGLGTWLLSGSNVYRGSTILTAGKLALAATGSINLSSNIDVQAGATFDVSAVPGYTLGATQMLQGAGSVIGTVIANGTVAPGNDNAAVATLSFANGLVLAGTNIMDIDKLNATNDMITAASLTYGGTLVLNEISSTPFALNDTFKLFNAGTYSGAFTLVLPALDSTLSWDVSKLTVDGTIKVGPASTIPLTPTNITFVVTGNKLDISWPANYTGYSLESQTNVLSVGLSSNWFVVPGSTLTNRMVLDIDPTKGTVYFRLRYTKP